MSLSLNNSGLRIAVTGLKGQVVSAIIERAPRDIEIIALGRPQLELSHREAVLACLRQSACDVIINAAAYTQVDRAESEEDLAMRVNGEGAGHVACAARALGAPLIHFSTDYVFSGLAQQAYCEDDATEPASAYGRSKLAGEEKIRATHANHVILRTAWVYSPFGANFVKTMLRLGAERAEIGVVDDQIGNPTNALDIADALFVIARKLKADSSQNLRGTFHMTGQGEASWADMAEAVFQVAAQGHGRRAVRIRRISTQDYPTAAKRPINSRLDNRKLEETYGVRLPEWRESLASCVDRLLTQKN